jgi:hypothetical protein
MAEGEMFIHPDVVAEVGKESRLIIFFFYYLPFLAEDNKTIDKESTPKQRKQFQADEKGAIVSAKNSCINSLFIYIIEGD